MTIADFISALAVKAGIEQDNEDLKGILSANDLNKIEMPENLFNSIDNNVLSLDAAKNHSLLKKHYHAQALNGLDSELEKIDLPEEILEDAKKEKTTFTKVRFIINKLKEQKATSTNKGDKDAYQKQIDELTQALKDKDDEVGKAKTDYDKQIADFKLNTKLESVISGYKTVLDDLDPDVKATSIRTLINKNLQDKNVEIVIDENGKLILQNKEEKTVYLGANHQPISFTGFVDSLLAQNKILKTTEAPPPENGGTPGSPSLDANKNKNSGFLKTLIGDQLQHLETNRKAVG